MKSERIVSGIIEAAKQLGLGDSDIRNSEELLRNREYGLTFDTVITQLYEYEIEINNEFYALVVKAAQQMKIPESEYSYLNELIRDGDRLPKP